MGWLIWHAESDSLFIEHDPEALESCLMQGAEDVTGITIHEERFAMITKIKEELAMEFKLTQFQLEYDLVHKNMIKRQVFSSCLNCIEYNAKQPKTSCMKFKMTPPPEVIVYSCGENWEGDIPF